MDTFTVVMFSTVDNETFDLLNNMILEQQLSFTVTNNNNTHQILLKSNDPSFSIEDYLKNKISTSLNIITNEDYKSLVNLLYNEQHSIIKYNDINILKIDAFYNFDSNEKNISIIKKNFINKLQQNSQNTTSLSN